MGKVILEIDEHQSHRIEQRVLDQGIICIGRAFDNDVIISDGHVSEHHCSLRISEHGWVCEDTRSLNGTFRIDSKGMIEKTSIPEYCLLRSGDTILIGKTTIRILAPNHAISPTLKLSPKASATYFQPSKITQTLILTLIFFYLIFFLVFTQEEWKNESSVFQTLAKETGVLFLFMLWAVFWAIITRFSKRQHLFRQHLTCICQWTGLTIILSYILKHLYFIVCNAGFETVISLITSGVIVALILNTHLSISTNLSFSKRVLIAVSIPVVFILTIGFSMYGQRNEFNPNPQHYINTVPLFKQYIPTITIDQEIKKLDRLFK